MKKVILTVLFLLTANFINAQYIDVNERLNRLEEKRGMTKADMKDVDINNRKFILVKEFDDHTERMFISVNGDQATYAEVFDDKSTGESSSNVFSGDALRTSTNMLSFRFDHLEGKKVALPVVKNLMLAKQRNVIYLIDVNTKERWIDEAFFGKK